jgi:hypothetical protein
MERYSLSEPDQEVMCCFVWNYFDSLHEKNRKSRIWKRYSQTIDALYSLRIGEVSALLWSLLFLYSLYSYPGPSTLFVFVHSSILLTNTILYLSIDKYKLNMSCSYYMVSPYLLHVLVANKLFIYLFYLKQYFSSVWSFQEKNMRTCYYDNMITLSR